MDNEGFRNLLAQQRPRGGGGKDRDQDEDGDRKDKKTFFKKRNPKKERGAGGSGDEEDEDKLLYRDRAEERRRGANPDYEDDQLLAREAAASVFMAPGQLDKLTDEERRQLEIENSKYLGGDEKYTHLVKGLDYALYRRVKEQMHEEGQGEDEPGAPAATQKAEDAPARVTNFNTALGRAVYTAVFEPTKVDVSDMFHPKRTCFVFDLGNDAAPEVPTTVHRAKEDCPAVQETLMGALDSQVLGRFSRVMSYLKVSAAGRHGRRLKKQERQHILQGLLKGEINLEQAQEEEEKRVKELDEVEQREEERLQRLALQGAHPAVGKDKPSANKKAVDDEDIFGDAGTDYVPTVAKRQAGTGAVVAPPPPPRFDAKEIYGQLPPVAVHGSAALPTGQEEGELQYDQAAQREQYGGEHHQQYAYGQYDQYGQYVPDPYGQYLVQPPPEQPPVDPKDLPKEDKDLGLASVFRGGDPTLWRRRKLTDEDKKKFLGLVEEEEEDAFAEEVVDAAQELDDNALLKMKRAAAVTNVDYWTGDMDDEDEDLGQMDGKKPEKSRYDFATEEEWQGYKSEQQNMPKAAFQFGVKKGDGRLSHKSLLKKQDAKIAGDLSKIKGVFKEKGWGDDGAFVDPAKAKAKESGKRDAAGLQFGQTPGPERNKRLKL